MSHAPSTASRPLRWLNLYLILILMGLCGMLFAQQLPNPVLRTVVVLLSLSAPLFAGGHLVARLESGGYARIVLGAGVIMLVLGAIATMAQFPEMITVGEEIVAEGEEETPKPVLEFSRWLGLLSLILGVVAILLIVARREWQIEELGHRFQSLAEHMSEGFLLSDSHGKITLVNRSLLSMTGLSESDLIGHHIETLLEDMGLEPEIIRKGENGALEVHVAASLPSGDRFFWVSNVPVADAGGDQRGNIATVRDMTEHRRMADQIEGYAEELEQLVEDRTKKLARSEHRLRDLLLQMSEGIVTVDDEFVIRFVNNRFCEMVQAIADDVSGRSLLEFLPGVDKNSLEAEFGKAPGGSGSRVELNLRREDGTEMAVLLGRAPFHDDRDEGLRYSIVLTDVGELKAMQRQLQDHARELEEANRELKQLDRAKDGFLTNVSHELRTPLSTIRGYLEMLKTGGLGEVPESQLSAVDVMVRNTERLSTLIAEMINFSRMQIQGVQLHTTLLVLDELLEESIASAKPEALRQGIDLQLSPSDESRIAWGDAERVGQILSILLSNAIKFSNQGGKVEISAECSPDGDVRIAVRDNGIGIPKSQQNRVFDKFYQVDGALNRRFEGAGIGLSIAQSLAEAHGGRIDLESDVGKGSTFTLVLPNAVFDPSFAPDSLDIEAAPVLLMIEDEGIRNALHQLLAHNGASVVATSTSFEGIRKSAEQQPAIVIASARLRELDGAAVVHNIVNEMPRHAVQGIVLSRDGDADGPVGGGVAALERPFTPAQALQCVSLLYEARALQQAADGAYPMTEIDDRGRTVLICGPETRTTRWIAEGLRVLGYDVKSADSPAHVQTAVTRKGIAAAIVDNQEENHSASAAVDVLEQGAPDSLPLFELIAENNSLKAGEGRAIRMCGIVSLRRLLQEIAHPDETGQPADVGVKTSV